MTTRILTFERYELFAVVTILLVLFGATFINLSASLLRSRDNQRKSDLRSISNGLVGFQADFSVFPQSIDNKIAACVSADFDPKSLDSQGTIPFIPCNWGEDAIRDVTDLSYPAYQDRLPRDPKSSDGTDYLYISNGRRFQLFAHLESGAQDNEYSQAVEKRNLLCGDKICNFGVAFSTTPLDKTLEEYENELRIQEENERKLKLRQ